MVRSQGLVGGQLTWDRFLTERVMKAGFALLVGLLVCWYVGSVGSVGFVGMEEISLFAIMLGVTPLPFLWVSGEYISGMSL